MSSFFQIILQFTSKTCILVLGQIKDLQFGRMYVNRICSFISCLAGVQKNHPWCGIQSGRWTAIWDANNQQRN